MDNIERACDINPNHFWDEIKKLGPRKCNDIPMEVYGDRGEIVCDQDFVLNTWKKDFHSLYNSNNEGKSTLESNVLNRMLNDSIYLKELTMNDPLYEPDNYLNADITLQEVKFVIKKAKLRKAVGVDNIPNEVLKNESATRILKELFQLIFNVGKVPKEWTKAIIKPIPKSGEDDPQHL